MSPDAGVRVLILDDDVAVGRLIVAQVEHEGYEARFTESAADFLHLHRTWDPTHVVVDLVMSGTDGLEVLRSLAQDHCEAQVIIASGVSGRVMEAARRLADEEGLVVAGLLRKPFSRAHLMGLISIGDRPGHHDFAAGHGSDREWAAPEFTADFLQAVDHGLITVAYQPKVHCSDGALVGFEALARWHHPERGDVPPSLFVPRTESLGLVSRLTESVATQALSWFREQPGHERMTISLNISAAELGEPGLDRRLLRACEESGVPSSRVVLELTETGAMDDAVLSLEILTRLRLEGFLLSLDDFGTGYSSMVQLARLPFTEIKVDRSFVMTASRLQESVIVMRSIIDLGHSLGLECTAEGVEDAETNELLRELGCDIAQGYFVARPMTPAQVGDWLSERSDA